jgi:hypothetical protein
VYSHRQPDERWKKMGYFKNLEIELQEIHDPELRSIVAWDHAHRHLLTPDERWRILTDEVLLKRAIVLWENLETPEPKPASSHVALQQLRPRRQRKSRMCVIGWSMVIASIVASTVILVVSLWGR